MPCGNSVRGQCVLHPASLVLGHEVDVHTPPVASGAPFPRRSCPLYALFVLRGVSPQRMHIEDEMHVSVQIRRRILGASAHGATHMSDEDLAFGWRKLTGAVQDSFHGGIAESSEIVRSP